MFKSDFLPYEVVSEFTVILDVNVLLCTYIHIRSAVSVKNLPIFNSIYSVFSRLTSVDSLNHCLTCMQVWCSCTCMPEINVQASSLPEKFLHDNADVSNTCTCTGLMKPTAGKQYCFALRLN